MKLYFSINCLNSLYLLLLFQIFQNILIFILFLLLFCFLFAAMTRAMKLVVKDTVATIEMYIICIYCSAID